MFVQQRAWPVIDSEKLTGIIPAITEGHMQAPALYARPDYETFRQNKEEKGKVLTAKLHHKESLQKYFGTAWKKHLNIPSKSMTAFHMTF